MNFLKKIPLEAGAIFSFIEAIACFACAGINMSVINCILTGVHDENFHGVTLLQKL